jgi:hypothetical protein
MGIAVSVRLAALLVIAALVGTGDAFVGNKATALRRINGHSQAISRISQHLRKTQTAANLLQEAPTDVKNSNNGNVDWSFIDDVYLITTTQKDNQRLQSTQEQLEKVDLWGRVNVRVFTPDDGDRVRGCYTSHMKVLEEAQEKYKDRKSYQVLILEDNLETTLRMDEKVVESVSDFVKAKSEWDVFHLAYMMYVPGLSLHKDQTAQSWSENVVQMKAGKESAVGTSAYIISKSGVDSVLRRDRQLGYTEAIPNIMSELFPESRYAAYPMMFHRAGKVGSLVNPQLDDFRKVMFNPGMYTLWERLMTSTGLQNNQLFPALLVTTLLATLYSLYSVVTSVLQGGSDVQSNPLQLLAALPLGIAVWGATLFTTDAGFAPSAKKSTQ